MTRQDFLPDRTADGDLLLTFSTGVPNSVGVRWDFIRECMKINKIRPKFHFLTKKRNKNDSPCVFVLFCFVFFVFLFFYCLVTSKAICKPFYRGLRFLVVLTIRKMGRLETLKPTVQVRSSINLIKTVQTRQNCRQRICR